MKCDGFCTSSYKSLQTVINDKENNVNFIVKTGPQPGESQVEQMGISCPRHTEGHSVTAVMLLAKMKN